MRDRPLTDKRGKKRGKKKTTTTYSLLKRERGKKKMKNQCREKRSPDCFPLVKRAADFLSLPAGEAGEGKKKKKGEGTVEKVPVHARGKSGSRAFRGKRKETGRQKGTAGRRRKKERKGKINVATKKGKERTDGQERARRTEREERERSNL